MIAYVLCVCASEIHSLNVKRLCFDSYLQFVSAIIIAMDARNRLNQLNKNKRFNKGKGKVNDLRQLISFPGKKGTNVRARIGFTSKSRQQRQIMSQNNRVQKVEIVEMKC